MIQINTAGPGSSQPFAPKSNFKRALCTNQQQSYYREREITDKTVVITDRGGGRNYPSRQVGKKICSVNSFPDPTLVSVRNLNTYTAWHNDKNNFVLNVQTNKCKN